MLRNKVAFHPCVYICAKFYSLEWSLCFSAVADLHSTTSQKLNCLIGIFERSSLTVKLNLICILRSSKHLFYGALMVAAVVVVIVVNVCFFIQNLFTRKTSGSIATGDPPDYTPDKAEHSLSYI